MHFKPEHCKFWSNSIEISLVARIDIDIDKKSFVSNWGLVYVNPRVFIIRDIYQSTHIYARIQVWFVSILLLQGFAVVRACTACHHVIAVTHCRRLGSVVDQDSRQDLGQSGPFVRILYIYTGFIDISILRVQYRAKVTHCTSSVELFVTALQGAV